MPATRLWTLVRSLSMLCLSPTNLVSTSNIPLFMGTASRSCLSSVIPGLDQLSSRQCQADMATQLSAMEGDDEDSAFVHFTQNTEQPWTGSFVGFIPFRLGNQLHPYPLTQSQPQNHQRYLSLVANPAPVQDHSAVGWSLLPTTLAKFQCNAPDHIQSALRLRMG